MDVRLTTCSGKNIVTKSKEATAGLSEGQLAEASEEGFGSKGGCCANDDERLSEDSEKGGRYFILFMDTLCLFNFTFHFSSSTNVAFTEI